MRAVAAQEFSCLIEACKLVIFDKLQSIGGEGSLIAVNHLGQVAMPYNSPSMYRAHVSSEREVSMAIFEE
jgi:beta-aspartyl-peptidase (threonine type)